MLSWCAGGFNKDRTGHGKDKCVTSLFMFSAANCGSLVPVVCSRAVLYATEKLVFYDNARTRSTTMSSTARTRIPTSIVQVVPPHRKAFKCDFRTAVCLIITFCLEMVSGASRVVNWTEALEQEDRKLNEHLYEQSGEAAGELEARGGVEQGPVQSGQDTSCSKRNVCIGSTLKGVPQRASHPEYTPHPLACSCGEKPLNKLRREHNGTKRNLMHAVCRLAHGCRTGAPQ